MNTWKNNKNSKLKLDILNLYISHSVPKILGTVKKKESNSGLSGKEGE